MDLILVVCLCVCRDNGGLCSVVCDRRESRSVGYLSGLKFEGGDGDAGSESAKTRCSFLFIFSALLRSNLDPYVLLYCTP